MKSSEEMNIPQVNPDSILNVCIADLKEAELNALDPTSYNDWRSKGLINRDAIDAILADIYLWRASVLHSASDYQECVNYCDKVIASKQANHQPQRGELTTTCLLIRMLKKASLNFSLTAIATPTSD